MGSSERVAPGIWVENLKDHHRVRVKRKDAREGRNHYPFKSPDREKALAFATTLARNLTAGTPKTVGFILEAFREQHLPTLRIRTQETWEGSLDNHLIPGLGSYAIEELRRDVVFAFGESMVDRGLSGGTIRNTLTVLRAALNWYWIEHDLESRCPGQDVSVVLKRLSARYNLRARPADD